MRTFTQLKNRAWGFMGINPATATLDVTNGIQDINDAQRIIEASARRYFTRGEFTADLKAGQQYYTLPAEMVRATTVRANTGDDSYNWPVTEVDSEPLWNKFNVIPSNTVIVPQFVFMRGSNELGMYPVPSTNTPAGLIVSGEMRASDMGIDDITNIPVNVTNGSVTVTPATGYQFTVNMTNMVFSVTDGTDGKWYRIANATASALTLENVYEGVSEASNNTPCIIGQAPLFPEAYHMGCAYYAAAQYFMKRGDDAAALAKYEGLFNKIVSDYKATYAAKTTGMVKKPLEDNIINMFWITPPGTLQA